jgi:hypothetical protein
MKIQVETVVNLSICVAPQDGLSEMWGGGGVRARVNDQRTYPHLVPTARTKCPSNTQEALTVIVCVNATFRRSRDSSVGMALDYGLDYRGSRVRFPAEDCNFSLHHRVQHSSGAHPASYPMGTRDSFPGSKVAGV